MLSCWCVFSLLEIVQPNLIFLCNCMSLSSLMMLTLCLNTQRISSNHLFFCLCSKRLGFLSKSDQVQGVIAGIGIDASVLPLVEEKLYIWCRFQYQEHIMSNDGELYAGLSGRVAEVARMVGCLCQSIFDNKGEVFIS